MAKNRSNRPCRIEDELYLKLKFLAQQENSVCISAKSGIGIEELLALISENLKLKSIEVTLLIPYTESEKAAKLHTIGTVLEQEYKENGTFMKVRLASEQLEDFEKFII